MPIDVCVCVYQMSIFVHLSSCVIDEQQPISNEGWPHYEFDSYKSTLQGKNLINSFSNFSVENTWQLNYGYIQSMLGHFCSCFG